MYRVLIFCGGTGSIALQMGLRECFGADRLRTDIVINAYDNGKSTGECRKLFDYQVLGPSDLRKNQLTQFSFRYAKEMKDETSEYNRLYQLFESRMTCNGHEEYYAAAHRMLDDASFLNGVRKKYLKDLLDFFFFESKKNGKWRSGIENISFENFAISNIFYTACAVMHKGSLAYAGHRMSEILEIPENVHLISDTPLLLKAYTVSGRKLDDESEIVTWNHAEDKISSVVLETSSGINVVPAVDEGIIPEYEKVSDLIEQADIILFSSGTQWSSLIPTYMHRGFREMISAAKAAKYLIMNNVEDADMLGVSSVEMCDKLSGYLDLSDVKLLLNHDAVPILREKVPGVRCVFADLGKGKKHDGKKLVEAIFEDCFRDGLSAEVVMYDLDGTLWNDRGSEQEKKVGIENLNLFEGKIVSGNSYEHVKSILTEYRHQDRKNVDIFCDYGNTYFSLTEPDKVIRLFQDYCIDEKLYKTVLNIPRYKGKVRERGGSVITIKPLEKRDQELEFLDSVLAGKFAGYQAYIAGNTSIDIMKREYHKANIIQRLIDKMCIDRSELLFVGNELYQGSEINIRELGIHTLNVRDVYECNVFLKIWNREKRKRQYP